MSDTPREALASALAAHRGEMYDYKNEYSKRPFSGDYELADFILAELRKEGGWELMRIIPKSKPFTALYPQETK